MIVGAPLSFWIGFHAVIAAILLIDIIALNRKLPLRVSMLWMSVLVTLALGFCGFLLATRGRQPALEFLSGYVIEGSLSIDNLFVFVLLFRSFGLRETAQRKALHWGVLGAIVLRASFIVAGIALLRHFSSVQYVFGAILLYASFRILRNKNEQSGSPPAFVRWLRRWAPAGAAGGVSLLLPIVAIELTDLVFAIDSVPAVLAVTHDTFLAYTSNIFAILGLRSLYFVLAGLLDRLRLLHYGLALVLAFVGFKMILAHWLEIPVGISLGVILGMLGIFTLASLRTPAPAVEKPPRTS